MVVPEYPPDRFGEFRDQARALAQLTVRDVNAETLGYDYLGSRLLPMSATAATLLLFRNPEGIVSVCGLQSGRELDRLGSREIDSDLKFEILRRDTYSIVLIGNVAPDNRESLASVIGSGDRAIRELIRLYEPPVHRS